MSRPHARHRLRRLGWRLGAHALLPVGPVAVLDAQRDRRAERVAMADAGKHLDGVALDLHAAAAPIAALAPPQLLVNGVARRRAAPAGMPSMNRSQAGAVRFAGRQEAEHAGPSLRGGCVVRSPRMVESTMESTAGAGRPQARLPGTLSCDTMVG